MAAYVFFFLFLYVGLATGPFMGHSIKIGSGNECGQPGDSSAACGDLSPSLSFRAGVLHYTGIMLLYKACRDAAPGRWESAAWNLTGNTLSHHVGSPVSLPRLHRLWQPFTLCRLRQHIRTGKRQKPRNQFMAMVRCVRGGDSSVAPKNRAPSE